MRRLDLTINHPRDSQVLRVIGYQFAVALLSIYLEAPEILIPIMIAMVFQIVVVWMD